MTAQRRLARMHKKDRYSLEKYQRSVAPTKRFRAAQFP
jgi:hypothetical protein